MGYQIWSILLCEAFNIVECHVDALNFIEKKLCPLHFVEKMSCWGITFAQKCYVGYSTFWKMSCRASHFVEIFLVWESYLVENAMLGIKFSRKILSWGIKFCRKYVVLGHPILSKKKCNFGHLTMSKMYYSGIKFSRNPT